MSIIVAEKARKTKRTMDEIHAGTQATQNFFKDNDICDKSVQLFYNRVPQYGRSHSKEPFWWYRFHRQQDANLFLLHFLDSYEIIN